MKQTAICGKIGFLSTLAFAFALLWGTGAACATEYTWNGGTGTWSTTAASWNGSTTWPASGNDNDAIFGGAAGTVTLGEDITVQKITANSPGYVIAGTHTFYGLSEVSVASGSLTIGANFESAFKKTGAGTLVLTGGVRHFYDGYLPTAATVVFTGVTIEDMLPTLTGTMQGAYIASGVVKPGKVGEVTMGIGSATAWFKVADGFIKGVKVEFVETDGNITARALEAKYISGTDIATNLEGSGSLYADGGNGSSPPGKIGPDGYGVRSMTYYDSVPMVITEGVLQIGDGGTSGAMGDREFVNNAVLRFNRSDTFAVANAISGTGSVEFIGTGTATLSGVSTYAGGTSISAGRVNITNASALGTGTVTMDGSGLADGKSISLYLTNNRTIFANQVVVNNTGDGEVILGSASSVQGDQDTNYFAKIVLNGNVTLDSNAGDRTDYKGITGTGDIRVTGGGRTIFGVNSSGYTYSGDVTIATTGSGSVQLGTNSASVNAIPDASNVTIEAGGVLRLSYNSGGGEAVNGLFGAGTVSNNSGNRTSNILTVGSANGDGDFRGTITGEVALVKDGTGTQIISGANNYSGKTDVKGGKLRLEGTGTTLGEGVLTVDASATLELAAKDITLTNTSIDIDGILAFAMSAPPVDIDTATSTDALIVLKNFSLDDGALINLDYLSGLETRESTLLIWSTGDFGAGIDWSNAMTGHDVQYWSLNYKGTNDGGFGLFATSVPEPATWVMLLLGVALAGWQRMRRKP